MSSGPEEMIASGDATICAQAFGAEANPVTLLIMGQMGSMLWWPDEFCEALAATGRRVVRYDNRDTGRSTSYPPGEPGYSSDDLVADAIAVLDHFGAQRADIVGISMGGAMAQLLAARHPERVRTLALLNTRTIEDDERLPSPRPEFLAHAEAFSDLDYGDHEAIAEMLVADERVAGGTRHPPDEARMRAFVAEDIARTTNTASLPNHTLMSGADVEPGIVATIAAPTLVFCGTADPLFPPPTGELLAGDIPDVELVMLGGGGHHFRVEDTEVLVAALEGLRIRGVGS